ncbi:protein ECT2-like [Centruroides sculpturatus]|uniref:protein ECT2-like n=1 Tax=Centruroides sculpturatus TaxID=218467 RepID=UPI000C6E5975|nr:protein ECT2-like [Centruroides sculpturatus]
MNNCRSQMLSWVPSNLLDLADFTPFRFAWEAREEQAAHHMPSPAISHYPKRKKLGDATYLLSLDKENSLQPSKLQNADGNNSTINSSTFDGIYSPDNKMATLVHHMGGCVKKEFSSKITHVIANSTLGEKYGYAVSLGTPIMKEQWIYEMWSRRRDLSNFINDENLMKLKLQPFCGCNITFLGFKNDEKLHMEELAVQNGGKVHETIDHSCTHLVLEERTEIPESISNCLNHKTHLVTSEWFWASIQMDACADEVIYNFKQEEQAAHHMPSPAISHYPKRKKLGDATYLLSLDKENSLQPSKLQNADGNNSTINSSTFDGIYSPDVSFSIGSPLESSHLSPLKPIADYKLMTPRQQVCTELLQTETNYVGILKTIVTMFKEPLEQPDQVGGALLDGTELKIIFGNIPPLYEVHTKLREDLYILLQNWKEDKSVGNIILKYSQDFLKAYPPFVNYFEKTKEVLIHCDQTKPRFHAFLKVRKCKDAFALIIRTNDELKERENLMVKLNREQLPANVSETGNTFSRAIKLASKTKSKLGRALSMKKTPTKRGLSRAMSTIISPLRTTKSPSSTLGRLHLPSLADLTDPSVSGKVPKAGAKIKSSSLGPSSSKYI